MYESNAQAVGDALKAASTAVFTDDVVDQILSLVTTSTDSKIVVDTVTATDNGTIAAPAGTEVLFVNVADSGGTTVSVTGDAPVILFQGAGGVDASIGNVTTAEGGSSAATVAGDEIERFVVGTAGADTITIVDGKNTQIIAGDGDEINAGTGHTIVIAAQGDSIVNGGGNTVVQAAGNEEDFTVSVVAGVATISNAATGVSVALTDVNLVELDDGDALVFADNEDEAAVANLYQAVFGRNADYSGLDFWYDRVEDGISLKLIAQGFLDSAEYTGDTQTDAQFLDALYGNLLARDGDAAGTAFWTEQLDSGLSRADVLVAFAELSVTGAELDVVGSVTIIDPTA